MTLEHGHVITLTHLGSEQAQVQCACGELSVVGPERMIRGTITVHRMESFGIVRYRLTQ